MSSKRTRAGPDGHFTQVNVISAACEALVSRSLSQQDRTPRAVVEKQINARSVSPDPGDAASPRDPMLWTA